MFHVRSVDGWMASRGKRLFDVFTAPASFRGGPVVQKSVNLVDAFPYRLRCFFALSVRSCSAGFSRFPLVWGGALLTVGCNSSSLDYCLLCTIFFFHVVFLKAIFVYSTLSLGFSSGCVWLAAAGAGTAVPAHDGVPEQRVLEQGQPRGLRPVLRLRLPEGMLEQVQRCRLQVGILKNHPPR